MSSSRLLSKQSVGQLLSSVLKEDPTGSKGRCLTIQSSAKTIAAINHVDGISPANQKPKARSYSALAANQAKLVQTNPFKLNPTATNGGQQKAPLVVLRQGDGKRLLSTSSYGAVSSAGLKRDASTQAQQQVAEQPSKYYESFRSSELEIVKCSPGELRQKPSADKLLFGHCFTDHMFRVDWDQENGWTTPLISKVHNLDIHPAAKVLHYAIQAFEGVKAFRGYDNKIRFFRLDANVKRLLHSAKRLSLPQFDELELIKCIHKLVRIEQDWIPKSQGQQQLTSLYLRPTILGVEPSLGVASSKKAILFVLLSPVGPYFKTGFKPVSLYADPDFVRAWPGGAGNSKLGSNYAPTILVQKEAEKLGLQQVLWLFGDDAKLTEVGTMNVFISHRNDETGKLHLITPPLTDGLILPGITRASIIDLARQWDDVVCEERYVTIGEIKQLIHEKRLVEMFGSGTACVVCPISSIQMKDGTILRVPYSDVTYGSPEGLPMETGSEVLTRRILKAITDIQYGKIPHPWAKELCY